LAVLALCALAVASVEAGEAEDALSQGIQRFDEGRYLAAQEVLLNVDPDSLSDADRARRDEYLERVQAALAMVDKANQDLEDGEQALAGGDLKSAAAHLNDVLANEYAPQALRKAAELPEFMTGFLCDAVALSGVSNVLDVTYIHAPTYTT